MELKLNRKIFTDKSTIGEMFIDGNFFCYTLEDVVRDKNNDGDLDDTGEKKVYGKTAIPKGKYEVIINYSERFKQQMPLLLNVKGFDGIRIHKGNTDADTHGCILLGKSKSKDFIGLSNLAYNEFMTTLRKVGKNEKIFITIA
jgi:hypothetical protein